MAAKREPKIVVLKAKVKKGGAQEYFWHYIGGNGKLEATAGEQFSTKGAAVKAARRFGQRCNCRVMIDEGDGKLVLDTPAPIAPF